MDINLNSNGNSIQVGNLTVLIGSDPFLPQLDSPTVEPEVITVDENLNTPPPPSVTLENSQENLTKPLHPYLEADICLDTESKQILHTPSSPLDKDLPLTDLGPIDPDIFASPPPKKRKRQAVQPKTLIPSDRVNSNILYHGVPTPIPAFIPPPPPQRSNSPVRPLLLVQPVHIQDSDKKVLANPPSLLQLIVSPTPDLLHRLSTSRIPYVTSEKRSHKYPPPENWLKGLTLQISFTEKTNQNSPKTLLQNQILK